jgi:ABC-type dipeptide/oligopeptide/nickel transport system permease component
MTRLIVVRLFFGALTLWAVSLVVFAATQALPGDAAASASGDVVPIVESAGLFSQFINLAPFSISNQLAYDPPFVFFSGSGAIDEKDVWKKT